jgi:hypothetical protein
MKKEVWVLVSICGLAAGACRDDGDTIIIVTSGGAPGVGGSSVSAFDGGAAGDSAGAGRNAGGANGNAGGAQSVGGSGMGGSSGSTSAGGSGSGGVAGSMSDGGTAGGSGSAGSAGSAGTAGSGGGPPLFFDDFNDGDADGWTTSSLDEWDVTAGNYGHTFVSEEQLVAAAGTPAWTDVIVQAKVSITAFGGSSTAYGAGVCARVQGDNGYCVFLRSNGSVALRKIDSGSGVTLGSALNVTVVPGTWYTMKISVIGSTISAEFEGMHVDSFNEGSLDNGGVGLVTRTTSARFDDVLVVEP